MIYCINIGKGIIVSVKVFAQKYHKQILKYADEHGIEDVSECDIHEICEYVVKTYIDDRCDVASFGHDAFDGCSPDEFETMKEKDKKINDSDVIFNFIGCGGEMMFIGKYVEINDEEMSGRVQVPEVIYTIRTMIPHIIDFTQEHSKITFPKLDLTFDQVSSIWTFTQDCQCCG